MTKEQIRAELRRSACEDRDPWADIGGIAFDMAIDFLGDYEALITMPVSKLRIFFLLVAEAM